MNRLVTLQATSEGPINGGTINGDAVNGSS